MSLDKAKKRQAANEIVCEYFCPQMAALPIRMRDRRVMEMQDWACDRPRKTAKSGKCTKHFSAQKQLYTNGRTFACDRLGKG